MASIIVFVAHSDDEVLGAGGTIAKYAKDGHKVHTIICSYGEMSHPHLQPDVIRKIRKQEAERADRMLGGAGVTFLGLNEGKFHDIDDKDFKRLVARFKRLKPEKVFTHDSSDSHGDHRAVNVLAQRIRKQVNFELYTFHVWTIINRQQGKTPMLCVDISDVFSKKIAALHVFRSQINILSYAQMNNVLYLGVYVRAIIAGLRLGCRYGEVFHKL